ncbi:DUF732 domain-containing protein [Paractinoplanes toevensis]|uniref:DUF732 domain-containing protein n=1 Tax=Paractinoplanes toevensis TaxID=571911 RepID=A0A919TE82_9ACTN|nr:DUF732 domain-containing protein [Actinoplanes toevensis]GIM93998.1 hypothetical protein Ato02nite_057910 [Actinoplanes toevensis]
MRRAFAAVAMIVALGGCSDEPGAISAVRPESDASPVPQVTATRPPLVTHPPSPRSASPRSPQAAETAEPAGAGSGEAGLDRFVAAVQKQLPAVALDRRDEEVEALGTQACDALAAGADVPAVAGELGAQGVTSDDAKKLIALARTTACRGRPKV